jgi:gliding motility-associated-like protein
MKLNARFAVLRRGGLRALMLAGVLSFFGGGLKAAPLTASSSTTAATCGNANGSITLTGSGGTAPYTYSFDGGTSFSPGGTLSNVAGGVYSCAVKDFTGLIYSFPVALGNIPAPSLFVTPIAATCANNDGEVNISVTGGTPPIQFQANGGGFGPGNLIGGLASGNVFVAVQDANGCLVTTTSNIPLTNNLTLAMGPGGTICQGTETTLTETTNATVFSWAPATGLDHATAGSPVASPASTTTYTLTAGLGVCQVTGTAVTVNVLPAPQPAATTVAQICYGQSTQLQGSGGVSYQWSPATYLSSTTISNPLVQAPKQSITYSLNVTDANGCTSVQPKLVLVLVTPPAVVFAGDDTAILLGQTLQMNAQDVNNAGFTSYAWSPALGLDNTGIQDPVATVSGDITYIVTATTAVGCTGSDSIRIKAVTGADIIVPTGFTPNGDGHNDVLRVHAIAVRDFSIFRVFNRWGALVFESANEGAGWDGWFGGHPAAAGVYVWEAVGLDFQGKTVERRGTVMLIR